MSNRYARILATGGAAVLMAALGVPAALAAATTWTVSPGGAITATSAKFIFTDTTNGDVGSCASSAARGTLKSGSALPGSHAGSLSAVSVGHCASPGGPQFTLHPAGLPWQVNFSSYNATAGVVRGTISHIRITALGTADCAFVLDGTSATGSDGEVPFRYTDSAGQLTLTTGDNLHFYNVSKCLGIVNTGDAATLSATFTVSPKQAITSP
jgi:hypothetical protein